MELCYFSGGNVSKITFAAVFYDQQLVSTSQNVISSKSLCKFCSTKSCSSGSVEPVFLLAQLLLLLVNKVNDITPGLLATINA